MNSTSIIILSIVAATVIVAGLVLMIVRKLQTQNLREQFGPEYDRVVSREGDSRKAEQVLEFRQKRREKFIVRPLSSTDRSNFRYRWNELQGRFGDDPRGALNMADNLVTDIMRACGYPTGDFDQQAADISVDHPVVVQNYVAAHETALRYRHGQASTEDLRNALAHYRVLFQELLDDTQTQKKGA
jgi:hypothetical protein